MCTIFLNMSLYNKQKQATKFVFNSLYIYYYLMRHILYSQYHPKVHFSLQVYMYIYFVAEENGFPELHHSTVTEVIIPGMLLCIILCR